MKKALIRLATSPPSLALRKRLFRGSGEYWDRRYAKGGNSGAGSYGKTAQWKADVVNTWVSDRDMGSVIDWGCGDGNQLGLARYERYLGLDRSPTAIRLCMKRFGSDTTKSFLAYDPQALSDGAGWLTADMALSMEVIFHLTEDWVFEDYMSRLFASAERYVVICSNDTAATEAGPTEKHRQFTSWIARNQPTWSLVEQVDPPADVDMMASLYLFSRS
jgi:hypothetical protein